VREGKTVRLADVAKAAGVNTSTVSRVLNRDASVSIRPQTRERIVAAARDLNYRPNAFARGLKLARTMTLGLVIPNLAYPVNAEIIKGAQRRAAAAGYVILLADSDEFFQAGDAYERLLLEGRVDGLLIASASLSEELLVELGSFRLPFVLVNRRVRKVGPSVTADDSAGMRLAIEHLLGLGHRRIGYITGPPDADTAKRRLAGFRAALTSARLRFSREMVVEASVEEESGFKAMIELLERRPTPTAVAVWSLGAAIGALAGAKRHGVRVPADLSLVAFHDVPIAAYLDPPLTTVRMPLREMAEVAVELLLGAVRGEPVRSTVLRTRPGLVERASTAPPGVR
jgi:LacI family transcriptional regulator